MTTPDLLELARHFPPPSPVPVWFQEWEQWRQGLRKTRPAAAPKRIPAWAWVKLAADVTPAPAPPTPPASPPSRWKNAPWTKKHVHISHGLRSTDGVWTVDQLVARLLSVGAKAVFAQIGGDCPDPDWAQHTRDLYTAGKAAGLQVGAWGRVDYIDWDQAKAMIQSVLPLDGFLADVEARCQDQQLPEHLVAEFPGLPLGVIATGAIDQAFDNHTPGQVAARFGDHFDFVGQDYHKTDLPLTPDQVENFVYWRSAAKVKGGFRHLPDANNHWHVPVYMPNAETCPPLATYEPWHAAFGGPFGVWDGELVEAGGEWDVFTRMAA